MGCTRRDVLAAGAGGIAMISGGWTVAADVPLTGDVYDSGEIVVHPVEHASFVLSLPGLVVYNDPVGGGGPYAELPRPGLILVTHEHKDHFDVPTLLALDGDGVVLVTNPAVYHQLPQALQAKATALANGAETALGGLRIAAVPAYNTTPDRLTYHPKGRDNGYVLETAGGRRIYIAGDTEDTPELRGMAGIDIAFVPMNLPYTMSVEQAAAGVAAFAPKVVYPYHYGDSDLDAFERHLAEAGSAAKVVRGRWYA